MCKAYLTATITLIDNVNMVNGMGLKGGEPVTFQFDGGGNSYDQDMYILTIDGEESTDNLRSIIYSITCASLSYFNDKANIVQAASSASATALASQIHNQYVGGDYGLNVKMSSAGPIGSPEGGGHQIENKKPIAAINELIRRYAFGGVASGSGVYFRDANSYVISPLEHLFDSMSSQATFTQRNTYGSDWRDTFTTTHIVISAMTKKDENANSSRGGGGALAGAGAQALSVFDPSAGIAAISQGAKKTGLSAFGGGGPFSGGSQGVMQHDTRRAPMTAFQGINKVAEVAFRAKVKDGVNYLIKVPIQGGIDCTVGKGITALLVPPQGDQKKAGAQTVGGLMLVADLCHECYFDQRTVQGTTTFRAVQLSGSGGDNAVA